MTRKQELEMYKRFAKEQLKKCLGISVPMTRIILLETGIKKDKVTDVLFEDNKTHKQYRTFLGYAEIID